MLSGLRLSLRRFAKHEWERRKKHEKTNFIMGYDVFDGDRTAPRRACYGGRPLGGRRDLYRPMARIADGKCDRYHANTGNCAKQRLDGRERANAHHTRKRSDSGGITFITVENGGHLVLDQVEVRDNTVDANGVVYVKDGGLLDLGYNDRRARIAPGISGNTSGGTAKNLVIEDGATIRLNAEVKKSIGISYASALYAPVSLIQGGRYTIQGSDLGTGKIISDSTSYTQVMYNDQIILRNANEETTLLVCELYFQQRRQRK